MGDGPVSVDAARRRRARVKTYAGQPIAPIVERLRYIAGPKRRAHLSAAVIDVGLAANRILYAITDQRLAGSRIGSGEIPISPALCDALVELFTVLARERQPAGEASGPEGPPPRRAA